MGFGKMEKSLRQAWRLAYEKGQHVIETKEALAAGRLQFALYRAMKEEREGRGDPLMRTVVQNVIIVKREKTLTLLRRDQLPEMEALALSLGQDLRDLIEEKSEEEKELENSQARFLEKMKEEK